MSVSIIDEHTGKPVEVEAVCAICREQILGLGVCSKCSRAETVAADDMIIELQKIIAQLRGDLTAAKSASPYRSKTAEEASSEFWADRANFWHDRSSRLESALREIRANWLYKDTLPAVAEVISNALAYGVGTK